METHEGPAQDLLPHVSGQLLEPGLSDLEPDAFAAVCAHLRHREVAALAASCSALRHAVACNDRLWAGLYSRQFPLPWKRLTQQAQAGGRGSGNGAVAPGGWRDVFLRTHDACLQASAAGACLHPAARGAPRSMHWIELHAGVVLPMLPSMKIRQEHMGGKAGCQPSP